MNSQRLLTILFASVLLSACAQMKPYRTHMPVMTSDSTEPEYLKCVVDGSIPNPLNLHLCEKSGSADSQTPRPEWPPNCVTDDEDETENRKRCEEPDSQAIQHRFYQTQDEQEGDYYLSFVEFDDQGWFADRRQMEALFTLLKKLEKEDQDKQTSGHTLIQVYAHGWKHNASACDNNVVCFSRLLERTDLAEVNTAVIRAKNEFKKRTGKCDSGNALVDELCISANGLEIANSVKRRTVVGVYLGWRGLPFETELNNISFWTRKDTAARVGRGGVFELLTRLKDYRDSQQEKVVDPQKTQLVITGHSFGGLVIYSALSHALMERAAKTSNNADGENQNDVAESFGDFVMLVNPAFEGSLYEPLFHIATNRCYPKNAQRPAMMIVTSEADSDTGTLFPIGRTLSTLFQHAKSPEQQKSMRTAIGHDKRYWTHELKSGKAEPDNKDMKPCKLKSGKAEPDKKDTKPCGCPYLTPTSESSLDKLLGRSLESILSKSFDQNSQNDYGTGVCLTPVESPSYASSYPYLVVNTDEGVIADHNAIYNDRFITFAQLFFINHIASPEPLPLPGKLDNCTPIPNCIEGGLVPCKQSCQLANGDSCSVPPQPNIVGK